MDWIGRPTVQDWNGRPTCGCPSLWRNTSRVSSTHALLCSGRLVTLSSPPVCPPLRWLHQGFSTELNCQRSFNCACHPCHLYHHHLCVCLSPPPPPPCWLRQVFKYMAEDGLPDESCLHYAATVSTSGGCVGQSQHNLCEPCNFNEIRHLATFPQGFALDHPRWPTFNLKPRHTHPATLKPAQDHTL